MAIRESKAKSRTAKPLTWNGRYGLSRQEALEDDAEPGPLAETFYDDVWGTAKDFGSLKQHPDYQKWMKQKGISSAEVANTEARLTLYKGLQVLDPLGFRKLITEPKELETIPCSFSLLLLEYALNTALTAALCLMLAFTRSQVAQIALLALLLCNLTFWLQGTSLFGSLNGLWLEDIRWGHKAAWRDSLLTNAVEVAYCVATLGLGGLVSMAMRLSGERGQNLGGRLFHLRLVQEVQGVVQFYDAQSELDESASAPARPDAAPRVGRPRKRRV